MYVCLNSHVSLLTFRCQSVPKPQVTKALKFTEMRGNSPANQSLTFRVT